MVQEGILEVGGGAREPEQQSHEWVLVDMGLVTMTYTHTHRYPYP